MVLIFHEALIYENNMIHIYLFSGFSMGYNQFWAGWVYDLCVYFMAGTPEGSTESGFIFVTIIYTIFTNTQKYSINNT